MISYELSAGPVRQELASAIRQVNAAHAQIGSPEIPDLKEAWTALDRSLSLAVIAGDDTNARAAVERYRERGLAAIKGAVR